MPRAILVCNLHEFILKCKQQLFGYNKPIKTNSKQDFEIKISLIKAVLLCFVANTKPYHNIFVLNLGDNRVKRGL